MEHKEIMRDKIMAMFLLGAIGDALGMPVEVLTKFKNLSVISGTICLRVRTINGAKVL